jgi:hypothetical protein
MPKLLYNFSTTIFAAKNLRVKTLHRKTLVPYTATKVASRRIPLG